MYVRPCLQVRHDPGLVNHRPVTVRSLGTFRAFHRCLSLSGHSHCTPNSAAALGIHTLSVPIPATTVLHGSGLRPGALAFYSLTRSLARSLTHSQSITKQAIPLPPCLSLPFGQVHVNYHPDKHERMKAVEARYVRGELQALDRFPDGSE